MMLIKNKPQLISCIVPFCNDNDHVTPVLDALTRVKRIFKIICIDDGSLNPSIAKKIKKQFPTIEVIRQEKNLGKSEVVKIALKLVKTPYVLLFDADIRNVISSEIDNILNYIHNDPSVDLLILKRVEPWYIEIFRWDKLLAGERVMRTEDLRKVFVDSDPPKGYQLECAINAYMMKNHKKAYWTAYSGINLIKIKKMGFLRGFARDILIHLDLLRYKGVLFAIYSFLFFCRGNIDRKSAAS